MNFLAILLAVSIATALFCSYCAAKSTGDTNDVEAKDCYQSPTLHFVDRRQFAAMYASEPHHVLFRLQHFDGMKANSDTSPQRLGITVKELEKCIPWVPGDSRVFICSPDGFAPSLVNQLQALPIRRDLFLIRDLSNDLGFIRMVVS